MNMDTTSDKENQNQGQIKPSHDEIAQRASQIWELAGHLVGRDAEYWLQAEAELLAARQRVRLPEVGVRRPARSAKQSSRSPQKAARLQEIPLGR
jgi:hypothetical protein